MIFVKERNYLDGATTVAIIVEVVADIIIIGRADPSIFFIPPATISTVIGTNILIAKAKTNRPCSPLITVRDPGNKIDVVALIFCIR